MPELDRGARTDGLTLAFDVGLVETKSSRTFDLTIDRWKIQVHDQNKGNGGEGHFKSQIRINAWKRD